jgi:hypothetical protein
LSSQINTPNKKLDKIVTRLRRRWLLQKLAYTLLIGVYLGLAAYWMTEWVVWPLAAVTLMIGFAALVFSRSSQYLDITANKVLLHLNRKFSECEESAELILLPSRSLTTLQQLQKTRIQPQLDTLLSTDLGSHLPRYSCKSALLLSALAVLIFTLIEVLPLDLLRKVETANTPLINKAPKQSKLIRLETKSMTVTPPSYTGLAAWQTTDLNLELIAGSIVTWQLQLIGIDNVNQQNDVSIMLPDKQSISLIEQTANHYQARATLNQSGVYYIAVNNIMLGDIHTLAVTADTKPTIRFIAPTETITKLAKNAIPKVQATISVEDDYGIGRVEILASIASGSGEAVKFRDQTFLFDSESMIEDKAHFFKSWDLVELGMQPGDELYFSIKAWDNRQPTAQQSRSASKIIRWLEDEQQGVLSDGVLMDFMPEYFKSQRQIIIETKELIADKNTLSVAQFDRTSRDLGAAQSFLKQKYGQFLGDEFDSGTLHSMEAGPEIEHDDHDEHDEHANEASQTQQASAHEHDNAKQAPEGADKSGYSQIIEQFGHAHGEADDGNFIKKGIPSPKLLMKRAIANMWQAELHLQLSEPELALPFETQALAFLNRAKQADRIYVKRLGFEPPPVSEKRRYQGDLSDILSYQRDEKTSADNGPTKAMAILANMLTNHSKQLNGLPLTGEQKNTLEHVKAYFSAQLTANPKDITFIATLEKIQQADSFTLENCQDCINLLTEKLWQTLPSPIAVPSTRQTSYSPQNTVLQKYQAFLQQHEKTYKKESQP